MRITPFLTIGIIILLLCSTTPFTAEEIQQNPQTLDYTITFTNDDLQFSTLNGYDIIHLKDGGITTEPEKPMLPLKNIYIALPPEHTIHSIHIIEKTTESLPGTYTIIPTQHARTLSTQFSQQSIQHTTPSYYHTNQYPPQVIELKRQYTQSGQNLIQLCLYPLQYNPHIQTLTFTSSITFKLETTHDNTLNDYLPNTLSPHTQKIYHTHIQELVINPEAVDLQTMPPQPQSLGVPPGSYDYVIITPSSFYSSYQPLAQWKTQKGVPATTVNLTWIYNNGGYSGTNKQKIRAFIQDAHTTWGASYFLLGADTGDIPYHEVTYEGDVIPTDVYYGDYDDDWIYEVMVGRASVINTGTGAGGVTNFVNKILTYEKNPPTSDYTKKVGLYGFDLDQWTDGEDCKIDIDTLYIPTGWSVSTVYDSHSGNHEDNVDISVNNGQHLINHIDHSSENYMGTGYTNHDWGLTNSEVDAFSNGNKQSIWYSIGCWASAFDFSNCIAEHFVRDTNGGGVAFVGNTRYGWYYIGNDDLASLRYDRYFFRSLFSQNHYILGDLFVDHKHDAYASMSADSLNKYIFSELNLLGDPEMPLWTENPISLTVTHPTTVPMSGSSFTVQVTSGGSNIQDATVCLWKGDELYQTSSTNATGQTTFTLPPTTPGTILVTVTKHNYLPYEGNATVLSTNQPPIADAGGPYTGETGQPIQLNGSASYDPDGIITLYEWDFQDDGIYDWSSPTTSITTYTYTTNGTYTTRLRVTDNEIAQDNDTATVTITNQPNNPPNIPTSPQPSNGQIDVDITTSLSWTGGDPDPGDTVTYDIYFGTTATPPLASTNQTDTTYNPGTLITQTMYYWQIVAWDNNNAYTKGPLWQFTTRNATNSPPDKPIISGKVQGRAGSPYTYSFVCTDPNEDDIYLYVNWGDQNNTGWVGPYQSGQEITLQHTWETIGSYMIRAKAKDINDAEGDWEQLPITMPHQTSYQHHPLLHLIQIVLTHFPLLNQLIMNILN